MGQSSDKITPAHDSQPSGTNSASTELLNDILHKGNRLPVNEGADKATAQSPSNAMSTQEFLAQFNSGSSGKSYLPDLSVGDKEGVRVTPSAAEVSAQNASKEADRKPDSTDKTPPTTARTSTDKAATATTPAPDSRVPQLDPDHKAGEKQFNQMTLTELAQYAGHRAGQTTAEQAGLYGMMGRMQTEKMAGNLVKQAGSFGRSELLGVSSVPLAGLAGYALYKDWKTINDSSQSITDRSFAALGAVADASAMAGSAMMAIPAVRARGAQIASLSFFARTGVTIVNAAVDVAESAFEKDDTKK